MKIKQCLFLQSYYNIIICILLLIGFVLRCCTYIIYRPLWRDECCLAWNVIFKNFQHLWGILDFGQSSPPLFLSICKIIISILPEQFEYTLRLFPFISGIASLWLFYLLTKKMFDSKFAIIIANFLFAVNTQLIYFSHEFKQYSTDVLIILICILYFSNLNIKILTKKQILINSLLIAIIPLLSLPSIFAIGAWVISQICKKNSVKNIIFILIPTFIVFSWYYLHILYPSRQMMLQYYQILWQDGFIKLNIHSIYSMLENLLYYYFDTLKYPIILLIFILSSIYVLFKRKEIIAKYILLILLLAIIASYLSLYPLYDRTSLYLLPLAIILVVLPFDSIKYVSTKLTLLILLCFSLMGVNNPHKYDYRKDYPNLTMQILKNNYNDDIIIYNDNSDAQFWVYKYIYKLNVKDGLCKKLRTIKYDKNSYYDQLDELKKGQKYWFYYSYDSVFEPVIPYLKDWAHKKGKIIIEKEFFNTSYILYLQL